MKPAVGITLAASLAVLAFTSQPAAAQRIINAIKSPFTDTVVDGKRGPFIQQIKGREFKPPAEQAGALGFGALEQGDVQRARIKSAPLEASAGAFLAKLDARWPYARYGQPKIYLVATNDYLANAKPDGSMTLSFGLLDKVDSDDELAFLLAHELMHLRLNHFAREQKMGTMRQFATRATRTYREAVAVSQLRARSVGGEMGLYTADQKRVQKAAHQAAASRRQMDLMLSLLVESPWARANEDEADAGGYDIAEASGYSSESGSAAAFRHMQADYDARQAAAALVQSQMTDALEVLSTDMQKVNDTGSGARLLVSQAGSVKKGLKTGVLNIGVKFFQQQHRSPETRIKGVSAYSRGAYPNAGLSPATKRVWLNGVRATPAFKQAKIAINSMAEAQAVARAGEFEEAARLMAPALRTIYAKQPFVANESGRIWAASGDFAKADAAFTTAHLSPDQTIDGYQDHVEMLVDIGNYAKAAAVTRAAVARYKDERPFLPSLITISLRTGPKETTEAYLQKCMATESNELKDACMYAMFNPQDQKRYDGLPPHTRAVADAEMSKRIARASTEDSSSSLSGVGDFFKGLNPGGN
jgi:Zn-dependent protease with chaperone function